MLDGDGAKSVVCSASGVRRCCFSARGIFPIVRLIVSQASVKADPGKHKELDLWKNLFIVCFLLADSAT